MQGKPTRADRATPLTGGDPEVSTDQQSLSPTQADGLACVGCAVNFLAVPTVRRPVGRSATGSQVFACHPACRADGSGEPCRTGDAPVITEAAEWLALHRAQEGAVAKLNGCYVNHGRPVIATLDAAFDDLIAAGLLALGQPDSRGRHQVCLTPSGQARYTALLDDQTRLRQGCADEYRQS